MKLNLIYRIRHYLKYSTNLLSKSSLEHIFRKLLLGDNWAIDTATSQVRLRLAESAIFRVLKRLNITNGQNEREQYNNFIFK